MKNKYKIYFSIYCIILYTMIRGGILIIMPIVPFLFAFFFEMKINKRIFDIYISISILSSLIALISQWGDVENILLSFWLLTPLIWLFLSKPTVPNKHFDMEMFVSYTSWFLIIVDVVGIVSYEQAGNTLVLVYGKHYEMVHGLAMINIIYLFYYGNKLYKRKGSTMDWGKAIFFFIIFFMCDYGVGKMCLMGTIGIYIAIHRKIRYLLLLGIAIFAWTYIAQSEYFDTEIRQLNEIKENEDNARKYLMYSGLPSFFSENPSAVFWGCGPGCYNSRATQLLDPDADNVFTDLLDNHSPYWYRKYIYPLWNSTFVSQASYTDGTRNKPFSSFVAMLCEQGFIVTFLIFGLWIKRIIFYVKNEEENEIYSILLWMNIFFFISCIVHEWMVCTEFIVYLTFEFGLKNALLKHKCKTL